MRCMRLDAVRDSVRLLFTIPKRSQFTDNTLCHTLNDVYRAVGLDGASLLPRRSVWAPAQGPKAGLAFDLEPPQSFSERRTRNLISPAYRTCIAKIVSRSHPTNSPTHGFDLIHDAPS